MKRPLVALVTLVLIALLPASSAMAGRTARHSTLPRERTVFGLGPELHLLPNMGRVGTKVLVVGLGYRPGTRVSILYGSPNAEFLPQPIATATVSRNGTFRTKFTVSCAFVVLQAQNTLHPPRHCPLSPSAPFRVVVVGGFVGHQFAHKRTVTQGFIVMG